MPRLIDFSNLKKEKQLHLPDRSIADSDSCGIVFNSDLQIKENISLLLNQRPGKMIYSLKEASEVLEIGQEFIRRRIKCGKIKAIKLGDKPVINVVELARILSEGV